MRAAVSLAADAFISSSRRHAPMLGIFLRFSRPCSFFSSISAICRAREISGFLEIISLGAMMAMPPISLAVAYSLKSLISALMLHRPSRHWLLSAAAERDTVPLSHIAMRGRGGDEAAALRDQVPLAILATRGKAPRLTCLEDGFRLRFA